MLFELAEANIEKRVAWPIRKKRKKKKSKR